MLSEKCNAFSRPLKKKAFKEARGTTIGLYAIGTSTPLESNKSLNPREPSKDLIAQFDQAGRFIELIEPGQRNGIATFHRFDPDSRIGWKVLSGPLIRSVQLMRQSCEFGFR